MFSNIKYIVCCRVTVLSHHMQCKPISTYISSYSQPWSICCFRERLHHMLLSCTNTCKSQAAIANIVSRRQFDNDKSKVEIYDEGVLPCWRNLLIWSTKHLLAIYIYDSVRYIPIIWVYLRVYRSTKEHQNSVLARGAFTNRILKEYMGSPLF